MANLVIENVKKATAVQRILKGINISSKRGEFSDFGVGLCCGKSTLMETRCRVLKM